MTSRPPSPRRSPVTPRTGRATRGLVSQSVTARSEPGKGSGRKTMPLTTVNMLVGAPMPSIVVTRTAAVKAGAPFRRHGEPEVPQDCGSHAASCVREPCHAIPAN